MAAKKITLPLTEEVAKTLHAGDSVLVTGTIYTSRDAGHKRMCEALAKGEEIPFDPKDATILHCLSGAIRQSLKKPKEDSNPRRRQSCLYLGAWGFCLPQCCGAFYFIMKKGSLI